MDVVINSASAGGGREAGGSTRSITSSISGKVVVLGVTGGIAAYKAAELVRRLVKLEAEVHVIMTEAAQRFVSPLTFRTLSLNPVITDMFSEPGAWNVMHISLARKADIMVVAPATANCVGKIASGIADDMLTTTIMATATRAPVLLAPSMNTQMFLNPVVQGNLRKLADLGYIIMEPAKGDLACGDVGKGRMPEPGEILERICHILSNSSPGGRARDLDGIRVLITAGPTQEALDPVRYITNRSSGKMGYALAQAARDRGARVCLISGPTCLPEPGGVDFVRVRSAQEMFEAVMARFEGSDVVIKAAAVADYRPARVSEQKIKKGDGPLVLELERTPDILGELGRRKGGRLLVGFAAETRDVVESARDKLARKNLDMIIANDVSKEDAGFNAETNAVTIIKKDGSIEEVPLLPKRQVAERVLDAVAQLMRARSKPIST
ncbi:MAG: bifunctional phosphopantothenoylcysteine decarboxylase/phosphopantothenate--cysteine ligase CoaBC [Firmicutes bacterium]|nr:bifunctional phosphopantothenoylcysteine decarboxylase/phosphopantothenate--cysteine ligase CoaBC [Bacillota bacterium]